MDTGEPAVMEKKINLERTSRSDLMDFVLSGKAGEIFPTLAEDRK